MSRPRYAASLNVGTPKTGLALLQVLTEAGVSFSCDFAGGRFVFHARSQELLDLALSAAQKRAWVP